LPGENLPACGTAGGRFQVLETWKVVAAAFARAAPALWLCPVPWCRAAALPGENLPACGTAGGRFQVLETWKVVAFKKKTSNYSAVSDWRLAISKGLLFRLPFRANTRHIKPWPRFLELCG